MINDTNILSVSELTGEIKNLLEEGFYNISIEGEISNFKHHSSGHRYFSLKDESAQISCVMWRSRQLNFQPEDGMKVIVRGNVTVYPPRGNYQIDVSMMSPKGIGDLFIAFEKLKAKLKEEGYFDESNKKEIPSIPMRIGVSTSPTGAAVKDIISTIERRFPLAEIVLRPTTVQGEGASTDIVNAIHELNNENVDVIIIGRGGGSIEDLWAYNMEEVAKAIFNSEIPIISAVGHETDYTISDFVADVRAATPTAAGEIATPNTRDYFIELINNYKNFFDQKAKDKVDRYKDLLNRISGEQGKRSLLNRINYLRQFIDMKEDSIHKNINTRITYLQDKLNSNLALLKSLDPKRPLKQGYAILQVEGKDLSPKDSLKNYKELKIVRESEIAKVKIEEVKNV